VLFGVKEIPVDALLPGKKYFFFSHTIKKQPYNRALLQAILAKNIELYDHETIVDAQNKRLIGFGRYAGIVGAYNGFRGFGIKYELFTLPKAETLQSKDDLIARLKRILLPNIKIVLTGKGKVGMGAKEMLDGMKIKQVAVDDFLTKNYSEPVYTQIDVLDYNKRIDGHAPGLSGINLQKYIDAGIDTDHECSTLDEAIEKCDRIHSETYNNKLIKDYDDLQCFSSSDEVENELQDDSEEEFTFNFIKKINKIKSKKSVRKTIVASIHYDKRWLKLKHCFHFLKAVGFERLNDTKKIKLDWNALHNYCKENEDDIYCLFDCKRMNWKEELDSNEKVSLSKYVNKKLENMLGINFEKISKNSLEYKLINLFFV
jgi:hypothetical protein